jgi:hypothetical protein
MLDYEDDDLQTLVESKEYETQGNIIRMWNQKNMKLKEILLECGIKKMKLKETLLECGIKRI